MVLFLLVWLMDPRRSNVWLLLVFVLLQACVEYATYSMLYLQVFS